MVYIIFFCSLSVPGIGSRVRGARFRCARHWCRCVRVRGKCKKNRKKYTTRPGGTTLDLTKNQTEPICFSSVRFDKKTNRTEPIFFLFLVLFGTEPSQFVFSRFGLTKNRTEPNRFFFFFFSVWNRTDFFFSVRFGLVPCAPLICASFFKGLGIFCR